ncbi:MAG: metalloregulator ArsR/SmtB family transcription factor [Actinomycetota bacterium]
MTTDHVVQIGKILSDRTRVELLDALFDGRAYTVTELGRHVGVATSTASEHLAKMLDASLVVVEAQGRHRYYRLRDPEVAHTLEAIYVFGRSAPVRRSSQVPTAMVYARTCYDHLAGTLAVAFAAHLTTTGMVAGDGDRLHVTEAGALRFAELGVDVTRQSGRRPRLRECLDWSERRHHHAGSVPGDLLRALLDRAWLRQRVGSRALELTPAGRAGLAEVFGFEPPALGDQWSGPGAAAGVRSFDTSLDR